MYFHFHFYTAQKICPSNWDDLMAQSLDHSVQSKGCTEFPIYVASKLCESEWFTQSALPILRTQGIFTQLKNSALVAQLTSKF
jgi:hypothetical protein